MNTKRITSDTPGIAASLLQVFRLVTVMLVCAGLVACATTPGESPGADSTERAAPAGGLAGASDIFNAGSYKAAASGFDAVISDDSASPNRRRQAHLGKALIYLGNDESWHSLENAKMALIAASSVIPGKIRKFSSETDMLMAAVSAAVGAESEYEQLQSKTSAETAERQRQYNALLAERDVLLKEQQVLTATLERMKNLTLGN